ncbi:hypothetical protein HY251_21150 [bacterium]|nr:hypothetical protein [bacterium]
MTDKVESLVADLVDVRLTAELPAAGSVPKVTTEELAQGVARSDVLKTALDQRFRVMLQHLEDEVFPRFMKKQSGRLNGISPDGK